jgi:hypothetical protein
MNEQIKNWSKRYEIPLNQFNICGFNLDYEPAREVYSNKSYPSLISNDSRFVFTSQALIQRNRHLEFTNDTTESLVEYSHIVIDEFDFTSGIIPTLDYQIYGGIKERKTIENILLEWVRKNYTNQDYANIIYKLNRKEKGFTLAHWIDKCSCPLTFLTSEKLSAQILKAVGFNEISYDSNIDFTDCTVNVWSSEYISEEFIGEMNSAVAWNRLDYELIISDRILTYFNSNNQNSYQSSLEVEVINHSSIRGSNNHIDKKILTVLSYIPQQVIIEIQEALIYFGYNYEYKEVERLFYRDRLCQAVGRTLVYRGGKESDLIIHKSLYDSICELVEFPYTFKAKDILSVLEDKDEIITNTIEKRKQKRERRNSKPKQILDLSILDNYFELDKGNVLTIAEIKDYLTDKRITGTSGSVLTVSKVAKYFKVKERMTRINGKKVRILEGLKFTM